MHLLTETGSYDRAAIMRAAHLEAAATVVSLAKFGETVSRREALSMALRTIWGRAQANRAAWHVRADMATTRLLTAHEARAVATDL